MFSRGIWNLTLTVNRWETLLTCLIPDLVLTCYQITQQVNGQSCTRIESQVKILRKETESWAMSFWKKLCAAEYILLLIGWTVEFQCMVGFSAVIRVYIGRSSFLKALTFYVYILTTVFKSILACWKIEKGHSDWFLMNIMNVYILQFNLRAVWIT